MNPREGIEFRSELKEIVSLDAMLKHAGVNSAERYHPLGEQGGLFAFNLILATKPSLIVEIGTSLGYSTVWLGKAAVEIGARVLSYEIDPARAAQAEQVLSRFRLNEKVEISIGDARARLATLPSAPGMALLDGAKEQYRDYGKVLLDLPRPESLVILADNMISHRLQLFDFLDFLDAQPGVSHQLVPVGKGLEFCVVSPEGTAT
jgi:predicted O-methyltransferase YrrM